TIALDALGPTYMQTGLDPSLMHRVAVIGAGTLDSLPHNGAVVTLLAVCGSKHRESYPDIVMVAIVGPIVALVAVIALGSAVGSFGELCGFHRKAQMARPSAAKKKGATGITTVAPSVAGQWGRGDNRLPG